MPLYKNNQPSSILVNNSFSIRDSGDFFSIEKGKLFSDSGFLKKEFNVEYSGDSKPKSELFLCLKVDPKTLYATGVDILNRENSLSSLRNENELSYLIEISDGDRLKRNNEDFFLLKNSGESPTFNCHLEKFNSSFFLKICSGNIQDNPAFNKPSLLKEETQNGQKIFFAEYDSTESQININSSNSLSFEDLEGFIKNDGEWNFSNEINCKIPICIVDFDRISVTSLLRRDVTIRSEKTSYGIDGRGYFSING